MAEKIFTANEQKAIEALAHKRGFKSLREYMRSVIESDAKQHGSPYAQARPVGVRPNVNR